MEQSSDYNDPLTGDAGQDGIAELAIDGNDDPTFGTSCTMTHAGKEDMIPENHLELS